ncbi:MAG: DUF3604 domain-containing protein [Deltaproteobacteria bacterium]|nr:DUF3604 domain-containing protein [Deltaproteobacteria bacterium]
MAQDPANPDLVAFLGWEWSQIGPTPETHYGHRNVILKDLDDDKIPARPIGATNRKIQSAMATGSSLGARAKLVTMDLGNARYLIDLAYLQNQVSGTPLCAEGVPERDLPLDCLDTAPTPKELFEKLDDWAMSAIVVPHGTTWGLHTPARADISLQLKPGLHDSARQFLYEVYSGHGNSEEYRSWRAEGPNSECPDPTPDYEPCCWRAGEIIRSRCDDPASAECTERVEEAKRLYIEADTDGFLTIPGATTEDWKDCGQCRDCFAPAYSFRPGGSAQAALAAGDFSAGGDPLRFRFGLIASSDNHSARPGTGYKEFDRQNMTDTIGTPDETTHKLLMPDVEPTAQAVSAETAKRTWQGPVGPPPWDIERQGSFFLTGGLVAVHAAGRGRDAIWDALGRREVYGTSGERLLLWFDLIDGETSHPMGSVVTHAGPPRFRVRAVGAPVQNRDALITRRRRWGRSASKPCATASATTRATNGTR